MHAEAECHWKPAGCNDIFEFDNDELFNEWCKDAKLVEEAIEMVDGPEHDGKHFYMAMVLAHQFIDDWSWELLPGKLLGKINKMLRECEEGGYDRAFDPSKYEQRGGWLRPAQSGKVAGQKSGISDGVGDGKRKREEG